MDRKQIFSLCYVVLAFISLVTLDELLRSEAPDSASSRVAPMVAA